MYIYIYENRIVGGEGGRGPKKDRWSEFDQTTLHACI
jgi:hypothetical protein